MYRAPFSIAALSFMILFSGCKLGFTPYDHCGATFSGRGDAHKCDPMYRSGSILSGGRVFENEMHPEKQHVHAKSSDCAECSAKPLHKAEPKIMTQPVPVAAAKQIPYARNISTNKTYKTNNSQIVTLEELRKSDPSIVDVRIINNSDSGFVESR